MIIDQLENIHLYKNIIPEEIFNDIQNNLQEKTDKDFVKNFIHYKTAEDKPFEQHQKNIDLHIILKGEESFGMIGNDEYIITQPYDEKDDASLGKAKHNDYLITPFKENQFAIFFKEEAHKVGWCNQHKPSDVEKIVYKFE